MLIRRSKTDKEGQGNEIAVPRGYPATAYTRSRRCRHGWHRPGSPRVLKGSRCRRTAATSSGGRIVKRYARRVGLGPAVCGGHPLRSRFLTSAADAGVSVLKMVEVSRHKSVDTLRGYVRRADLFRETRERRFCETNQRKLRTQTKHDYRIYKIDARKLRRGSPTSSSKSMSQVLLVSNGSAAEVRIGTVPSQNPLPHIS